MTKDCSSCACNWVCDHTTNDHETCGSWFPGWISVKDELPLEHTTVLVAYEGGRVDRDFVVDGRWVFVGHGVPAYWMPMPEAPEEVEEVLGDG